MKRRALFMTNRSWRALLAGAAGAALLSACGGGGDAPPPAVDTPAATSEVPASAQSSAAGAVAFVRQLAATRDDGAEPIRVGDAVLGTSETDEPVEL
jgi:hypothetical protein